jgi:hypothetical protein
MQLEICKPFRLLISWNAIKGLRLNAFEDGGDALADADAHGAQCVAAAAGM